MEYRRLGKSGLRLSALSFGSWVTFSNQLDIEKSANLMAIAYEKGVNFFDNAENYAHGKSLEIMGASLKKLGWSRDSYCVSSKVFWGGDKPTQRGLSRKHLVDSCNKALRVLDTDYLDLYFCHRPDVTTPIEETVRAMSDLVSQGKILYWGTSEWSAQQIMEAHRVATLYSLTPPTMEQPQYNLFERDKVERDYQYIYDSVGLGTTIWSPLASGVLTGKYRDGIPEDSRMNLAGYEFLRRGFESEKGQIRVQKARELEDFAKELGMSLTHLALAWCLKNKNVSTVILGASRESQLEENLKAMDVVEKLTDEVVEKIESIAQTMPDLPPDYLA